MNDSSEATNVEADYLVRKIKEVAVPLPQDNEVEETTLKVDAKVLSKRVVAPEDVLELTCPAKG